MKTVQNRMVGNKSSRNYSGTTKSTKKPVGTTSFKELIIDELKDIYWAEGHLVKNLPKMAKAATSLDLKKAFENHLKETETHVSTLEKIFKAFGETPKAKTCDAMMGLVKEAQMGIDETLPGTKVRDVALIMAAQKIEHYEIASYGTLRALAMNLGQKEAVELLEKTLMQEHHADELLTNIALGHVNMEAKTE